MDEFFGLAFASSIFLITIVVLPLALLGLAIPYAILRVRDSREEHRDSQIGIKSMLCFFASLSIIMILNAGTLLLFDLIEEPNFRNRPSGPQRFDRQGRVLMPQQPDKEDDSPNPIQRTAFGLIISGLIFFSANSFYLWVGTNNSNFPAVKKVFLGWRAAIHGITVFWTTTALIVIMIQKGEPEGEAGSALVNMLVSVLLVWAPSWLIHLLLLQAAGRAPYCRSGGGRGGLSPVEEPSLEKFSDRHR